MTLSDAVVLLRGLAPRFLDGLTPSERTLLLEAATIRRFPHGSQMILHGFPADFIFLLVQGRARFFCTTIEGGKVSLHWINPGEICGFAGLLSEPVHYLLSAETVKPSVALAWHHSTIRSFAMKCPRLLDNGLLLAFNYIRLYRNHHICATYQTARQRLAQALGDLAHGIGKSVEEGVEVTIRNEELAHEANVTIFTASRVLNEWQRQGILVKTRGKVMLRSPKDLLSRDA
jgi:CRP/FNR family transcriptional regulator, nitrogen oxide reductase regulator